MMALAGRSLLWIDRVGVDPFALWTRMRLRGLTRGDYRGLWGTLTCSFVQRDRWIPLAAPTWVIHRACYPGCGQFCCTRRETRCSM